MIEGEDFIEVFDQVDFFEGEGLLFFARGEDTAEIEGAVRPEDWLLWGGRVRFWGWVRFGGWPEWACVVFCERGGVRIFRNR